MDVSQQPMSKKSEASPQPPGREELLRSYVSDPDWKLLSCLLEQKEFNPSYRWIATKLGISVEKVVEIIEGLVVLGLVKRTPEGFVSVAVGYFDENDVVQLSQRDMAQGRVEYTGRLLDDFLSNSQVFSKSLSLSTDIQKIKDFWENFNSVTEEFILESDKLEDFDMICVTSLIGVDCLANSGVAK